jgi:hypothetical protein
MAASCAAMYVGFLAVSGFVDRYMLWFVPLLMVCVAASAPPRQAGGYRWLTILASVLVLGYGLFSVAGTHDYFAWNRSRWQALNYVMEELRVSPTEVDGGYEFNGWYGYDKDYLEQPGVSWWWVRGDEYVVTFGPLDGYGEILRVPYQRWLAAGDGEILVLQKLDPLARSDGWQA